jgi:tetratricopeptide (TPR) repeat protein
VFEIAVPREVFESVVGFGNFAQAEALGLLAVSPDGAVRVPRLLGLVVPQDETLAATAAQEIYEVWEKSESEIECLEMHRLAISGKVGAIAADIGSRLAHHWRHEDGKSWKAATLCKLTLEVSDSYKIWYQLAQSTQSLEDYQTTMDKLPSEDLDEKTLRGKAVIIHSAGTFHATQGRISDAIALYEESLAISKSISDQRGIATATYSIADAYRHQGKVDEALPLYEKSLAIQRSIGNQHGIAAILKDLGMEHYTQGNIYEGTALLKESLTILQSIGKHFGYYPHLRYGIPAGIEELIAGIPRERKRRYSSDVDDWDL